MATASMDVDVESMYRHVLRVWPLPCRLWRWRRRRGRTVAQLEWSCGWCCNVLYAVNLVVCDCVCQVYTVFRVLVSDGDDSVSPLWLRIKNKNKTEEKRREDVHVGRAGRRWEDRYQVWRYACPSFICFELLLCTVF